MLSLTFVETVTVLTAHLSTGWAEMSSANLFDVQFKISRFDIQC